MENILITSKSPHHQALEIQAANAVAAKDYVAAFRYADRRCRIEPAALAHCYVLRAEAAFNIGETDAALLDLKTALTISPRDLPAARRQFAWGNGADRHSAAVALVAHDLDVGSCRAAVRALSQSGQRRFASASVFDRYVTGWAVWDQDDEVELAIRSDDGVISCMLAPDPFHPLSSLDTHAAPFRVARPASSAPQMMSIALSGEMFFSRRMAPNARLKAAFPGLASAHLSDLPPTVIVPVFADFRATTACLDGLLADRQRNYRILIVNDDSPETGIKDYLASLAKFRGVTILSNPINLGFVGSVNRALAQLDGGDVVLLNADTIVPSGFVDRLKAAAQSGNVGTVVPLSNNGEITDFPNPNGGNPLGSRDDVLRLDRLAARSNKAAEVDILNGTGFCLYITRACLNAVGNLSESFQRGYLEDIDLCLRARERGFRNVCAASIYVGHAGSRSFRSEKRSLVLHNLDILDHRFPHFRRECAAFVDSDPLRSCRENIERQLMPSNTPRPPVLVLSGIGALRAVTTSRVDQLVAEGHFVIVLEVVSDNEGKRIRHSAAGGSAPQSLSFGLSDTAELGQWRAYLGKLRPDRCEMIGAAPMAPQLMQTFSDINIPVDLWVADGNSVAAGLVPERQKHAPLPADKKAVDSCAPDDRQAHDMISAARRILVASAMAKMFTKRATPGREIHVLEQPTQAALLPEPSRQRARQLAIVPARSSANELLIIRSLALRLRGRHQDVSIFVAGSTFDDLRLMSHDNVFVSGPIEASELGRVLRPHNVGWMLTGFDGPLFGHPLIEAARGANIPVAYLDWSRGATIRRADDLAIDPDLRRDQLVDQIETWIEGT